jgi:hypothetical protein
MDAPVFLADQVLRRSVLGVLRALVRVLMRHGVPLPAFVELAKRAYVDVALRDFAIPGRKPSISRAAVLTGMTRKDVQRLVDEEAGGDGQVRTPDNRAARVVAGWVRDADFQTPDGRPAVLSVDGPEPSFAALVKRFGGDVPTRAVLDELMQVGNVERDADGRLALLTRVYLPRASDAAKLGILGSDVAALIATIDHNLQSPETPRFQRKVAYDNLPVEAVEAFRELSARHSQELIDLLGDWLARHDRDTNPEVRGSGRVRAGVGVFFFEERVDDARDGA